MVDNLAAVLGRFDDLAASAVVEPDVDPEYLEGKAPPPPAGKKTLRVLN